MRGEKRDVEIGVDLAVSCTLRWERLEGSFRKQGGKKKQRNPVERKENARYGTRQKKQGIGSLLLREKSGEHVGTGKPLLRQSECGAMRSDRLSEEKQELTPNPRWQQSWRSWS